MSAQQVTSINSPASMTLNTGGIPVVQSFSPVAIDLISRTTQTLNNIQSNGFDVFQFHNTINDALRTGALSNVSMANVNSILNTFPSDWKTKFTSDESGMNDLLNNINGLLSLAENVWGQPTRDTQTSAWSQQQSKSNTWTYGNQQPTVHQLLAPSVQNNNGTYKTGMMNHPDNVTRGEVGALAFGSVRLASAGGSILGDSALAADVGEAALTSVGIAGETGLGVTAAAVGSAIGVTEVAAAAVGLAAVGYGIYKMAGGTGSSPIMDKAFSGVSSVVGWLSGAL